MDDDPPLYAPLRDKDEPIPRAETAMGWVPYLGLVLAIAGAFAAYLFVIFADLLP